MTFTVGVRYLCGWAMSTHAADREQAEWPPHPDRAFMALAAAHFATDNDPREYAALEWLEAQPAPIIVASHSNHRTIVTSYVPVNDAVMPRLRADKEPSAAQVRDGLSLLPERRSRQGRVFPVTIPENDTVYFQWPVEPPVTLRDSLSTLCRKVTYVGHSASLVQMWVETTRGSDEADTLLTNGSQSEEPVVVRPAAKATGIAELRRVLRPTQGFTNYRLRVPGLGRLKQLQQQFIGGQRPALARSQGYAVETPQIIATVEPHSHFDSKLVILRKLKGPALGLDSSLQITEALRGTVMKHCPQPVPEWVSGHQPDQSPSKQVHMAYLALAHVGHEHADGHILGVALVLPRSIPSDERRRCLGELLYDRSGELRKIELVIGRLGQWLLTLEEREARPLALVPETWTADVPARSARRWATVTPIVLDRHPKTKDSAEYWLEVESSIRQGCVRIGLPQPTEVITSAVSMFIGSPHARRFPYMQRKTGGNLHHTHAILTFSEPVFGPVLLGAGRYRGYGLCRPMA